MRLGKFETAGLKRIGTGGEKDVYVNPADEDKIISVYHGSVEGEAEKKSPRELKAAFYLTKIAHLLAPQVVPDISQAGEQLSGEQSIDRERLEHFEEHAAVQKARVAGDESADVEAQRALQYRMQNEKVDEVVRTLDDLGFGFAVDTNLNNFLKDDEGNLKYIETFKPWVHIGTPAEEFEVDETVLRDAIAAHPDENTRARCEAYLNRVRELFEEEKAAVAQKE